MERLLLSFENPSDCDYNALIYIAKSAELDIHCCAITVDRGLAYPCWNDATVTFKEYTKDRTCRKGRSFCKEHMSTDTFDPFKDPDRWIHLVAYKFFECSNQVPKSIIYQIAETLECVPFEKPKGFYIHNSKDIIHCYSKFYRRVNYYANRCICLLWRINGIHRDVRMLIARKLWKKRSSWANLVTIVWYKTPK